jgi:aminobenzoyl-glutamate utilization protein B
MFLPSAAVVRLTNKHGILAAHKRPTYHFGQPLGSPAAQTWSTTMQNKTWINLIATASIIDLMTTPELLQKARAEFEVESKRTPYFSLVPPDAKPDVELNRVEMDKYRADMKKFYLNKTPRFN